ncbi:hypothetical protein PLESTB_000759700 [Pleodorina starrii]|uniref:Uncharacterized protein n=1 Tax=Pleodorina starrii TaxID=330485 RepID=A0A9W6BJT5_9CHLO|nr:hypothetical protein PLESTM_001575500 [Pleodorina starrii]GLC53531.1 hypothetical protein PLESTB_000759700 [Pleodorina starrii]GLC65770.1 hypothetical protein PLESTF_000338100 [Pleodorina starrii]
MHGCVLPQSQARAVPFFGQEVGAFPSKGEMYTKHLLRTRSRLAQVVSQSSSGVCFEERALEEVGACCCHPKQELAVSSTASILRTYCSSSSSGRASSEQLGAGANVSGTDGSSSSSSSSHDGYSQYDFAHDTEDEHGSQHDRDRALRRVLRSSNAAELAAVHFFRGYSGVLRGRVDAQFFAAQEAEAAEGVRELLPRYRVRPSLAQGPLSLACLALGAAAAAAPPRLGLAVVGAVGDALSEHYNEQLRQINEAGAAKEAPDVRQTLRSLRDVPRVPEGAPPAPDLLSVLQEGVAAASGSGGGAAARSVLSGVTGAVREWGLEGTAGAVVKAGARVALEAASRC